MEELRGNLGRMLVFAEVAERASFSEAAKALRLSRPAVSASVAALEDSLGQSLLHRTTRAVSLTRVGAEFLRQCQQLRGVARQAWEDASAGEGPGQVLRVAMPGGLIADRLLMPALARVALQLELRLDVVCSDTRASLVDGGFDAAIRVGTPREAGLILRKLGRTHEAIVCGPEFARQCGRVDEAADLAALSWVVHTALPTNFTLHGPGRRVRKLRIEPTAWVNDASALVGLLRSNYGVGRVPRAAVVEELEAGTLVELMPDRHAGSIDLFVVYPSKKRVPARVRLMVEALRADLRAS